MKTGRPTKLTEELTEQLCALLRTGEFLEHACAAVGLNKTTVYDWIKQGESEPEDGPHRIFSNACARAREEGERYHLERINKIGDGEAHAGEGFSKPDWKARAWILERLNRARYGNVQKTELTGADGGPVKVETKHRDVLLEKLARIAGEAEPEGKT